MWVLALLIVVAIPVVAVAYLGSRRRRPVAPDEPGNTNRTDTAVHPPAPGEGSPLRDGSPVPGSESARRARGKP